MTMLSKKITDVIFFERVRMCNSHGWWPLACGLCCDTNRMYHHGKARRNNFVIAHKVISFAFRGHTARHPVMPYPEVTVFFLWVPVEELAPERLVRLRCQPKVFHSTYFDVGEEKLLHPRSLGYRLFKRIAILRLVPEISSC